MPSSPTRIVRYATELTPATIGGCKGTAAYCSVANDLERPACACLRSCKNPIDERSPAFSLNAIVLLAVACAGSIPAETIPVRYAQGSSHGFAVMKTTEGKVIAIGESTQTVRGDRVQSRLVFRFRDGSVDDDSTVFSQRDVFRLVSDHHIQHGPSFPKPIDFLIDATTGDLTWRAEDGTTTKEHMDLPADVSNGLPPNLLLNILPSTPETKISYVAPGKKARLIKLSVKPSGSVPFRIGGLRRKATDFSLHVELGGISGIVAPLVGKQPDDYHIWMQSGTPPVFIREEGPLYEGGPIWRIEQISPTFAR